MRLRPWRPRAATTLSHWRKPPIPSIPGPPWPGSTPWWSTANLMPNRLAEILANKRVEISGLDARTLRQEAEAAPAPRDFTAAVRRTGSLPVRLVAELKRASPSRGALAPHLDLGAAADIYADNGAAAISVLTDEKFFQGRLET